MQTRTLMLAATLLVASPAAADLAPPPPSQLNCPRGAVGEGTPVTSWCAPSTCESDADCTGGRVCSSDEIGLCVEDATVATERRSLSDEPGPTRDVRQVRRRGCEPDGTCLNLHAECETSRRCVTRAEAAEAPAEEPAEEPAGAEAAEEPGEDEPVADDEHPEEAEANHSESASGCSCRAYTGGNAPLAGLALLALGLVVARVRRRG